jgi:hypothetical protein
MEKLTNTQKRNHNQRNQIKMRVAAELQESLPLNQVNKFVITLIGFEFKSKKGKIKNPSRSGSESSVDFMINSPDSGVLLEDEDNILKFHS